ncbi:rhomboid family protein [Anaeromicropila herbilytica]|uniref:Peptidase S54 rhomboid domain-containing protein n=1 Tax=Anaeromicropila herbilytica TaxID=2785025 RepID=A0A7R7EKN5_9FIRM|nr:hypothetical protein [Anaeromicropila herbilytica]BCN30455.1 hypothetical protein bsdtb5_17500 [Anaeromicropila herbilytica]
MNFINKLERKFGRYKIDNLINYVLVIYGLGYMINKMNPMIYYNFFALDIDKVLHGQIWRLVTFVLQSTGGNNILFLALEVYFYYMIGHALENAWGAFRFNLYFFTGILFNILAAVFIYIIVGSPYDMGLTYILSSMFFAYAAIYPNMEILFMYILPIKVKYLAYLEIAIMVYNAFSTFRYYGFTAGVITTVAILVSIANFLIFFFSTRNYRRISPKEYKRKANFKKQVKNATTGTRHKCTICGRTELDDENLEFRFCSRCDGNYEYCMEHLFTHQHIHHN